MPFLGFAAALVLVAAFVALRRAADERQWTSDFLAGFGRPAERERDLDRLSAYYRARGGDDSAPVALDDRTWRDLDMDAVFAFLDRSASQVGGQALYDRLRRPTDGFTSGEGLESLVAAFGEDRALREAVTRELLRLRAWHVSYLPDLLWKDLPAPHPMRWLFQVLGVTPLMLLAAAPFWPKALLVALGVVVVNWGVKLALKSSIDPFLPALRALPAFLGVARTLSGRDEPALAPATAPLRRHLPALRFLSSAVKWISNESAQENVVIDALAAVVTSMREYVNLAFLLDVNAFSFAIDRVRERQGELRAVFAAVGAFDVALCVASVRAGANGRWTRPAASVSPRTGRADGVVHPLLAEPVPNDFVLDGRSWLVTGSNMSGKSTFLRAVGVNALLARTIGTVFATRWEWGAVELFTCIGGGDSLLEGKSYYLAEVERVKEMIGRVGQEAPHLFILDELFRGTNTIERVASARATLEALDTGAHVVLVATHDIELLRWLDGRYAPFHFREQVEGGTLSFDHRLRPGPSSTRNAIALLEMMGYPPALVARARATAAEEESARRNVAQQQREPGRE